MNLWHNIHIRKYFTIWHSYQTIWFWQSKVKTWQPLSTSVLIYLPGIQYPCHRPFSLSIRRLEYYVTAHKLQACSTMGLNTFTRSFLNLTNPPMFSRDFPNAMWKNTIEVSQFVDWNTTSLPTSFKHIAQ